MNIVEREELAEDVREEGGGMGWEEKTEKEGDWSSRSASVRVPSSHLHTLTFKSIHRIYNKRRGHTNE